MRVLVLSGPPAVGKSTVGRRLAGGRPGACAFIDVDDVRQLVVSGMVAPWDGAEGRRQRRLSAVNACGLANNFVAAGMEVVVADVVDAETLAVYRELLDGHLVVHLHVAYEEGRERALSRPVHLTWEEFSMLYREQEAADGADLWLDTTGLSLEETAERVAWGTPVCLDWYRQQPGEVAGLLRDAGFVVVGTVVREPVLKERTAHGYVLAQAPC